MTPKSKTYHVFLSYSFADRQVAETVRRALADADLDVFDPGDPSHIKAGSDYSQAMWQAIALSEAVVVILPRTGQISANSAAELGAATAWNRPILLIRPIERLAKVPEFLARYPQYQVSSINDVIMAIKRGQQPLNKRLQDALEHVYLDMNTPTDRFTRDPSLLNELAARFSAATSEKIPGERLLYEMIRLRKRGLWPRLTDREVGASEKAESKNAG